MQLLPETEVSPTNAWSGGNNPEGGLKMLSYFQPQIRTLLCTHAANRRLPGGELFPTQFQNHQWAKDQLSEDPWEFQVGAGDRQRPELLVHYLQSIWAPSSPLPYPWWSAITIPSRPAHWKKREGGWQYRETQLRNASPSFPKPYGPWNLFSFKLV